MAKIDRLKEEIGWLKLVFGVLIAVDASLIGWIGQNYTTVSPVQTAGAAAAIVVVTIILVHVNRLAYDRIEELEETSWIGFS